VTRRGSFIDAVRRFQHAHSCSERSAYLTQAAILARGRHKAALRRMVVQMDNVCPNARPMAGGRRRRKAR
jgi:hypothetical protein